jgi:hypothetical protein
MLRPTLLALLTISVHLAGPVSSAAAQFQPGVQYPAGKFPFSVAVGDFNGDGKADLAATNDTIYADDKVSVLLGNGDGTFQPHVPYTLGGCNPFSLAVGDFNRDAKLDLAVACSLHVKVLLGKGDGTFQMPADYGAGLWTIFVAVADLNSDSFPDLVAANNSSATVSVLLGKGDGTFQPRVDYTTGTQPHGVAVGDFNRDGRRDLAVANQASNTVSILLGKGDGTFRPRVDYPTGQVPQSVVAKDFNRDGKLDLAVATSNWNGDHGAVSVLLGDGHGAFSTHVEYDAGVGPLYVAVGDFNKDGKADLAVPNMKSYTVSVLAGNGDGTFQTHVDYATGIYPFCVVVRDLNGDRAPDLVVANSESDTVSVFLNTGEAFVTTSPVDNSTPGSR